MSNVERGSGKRKSVWEVFQKRREHAEQRNRTRVVLGDTFRRWRALKAQLGLHSDALFAKFLLDSFEKPTEASTTETPQPATSSPPSAPAQVQWVYSPGDETPQLSTARASSPPLPSALHKCPSCGFALPQSSLQNTNAPNEEHESESIEVALEGESEGSEADKWKRGRARPEDWSPVQIYSLTLIETKEPTEPAAAEERELGRGKRRLCPECGVFYTKNPHVCEHKTKPFVCNICGKRCVSESHLKVHNGVHSETHEHGCTYCHAEFTSKTDKLAHEAVHQEQRDPFKCPDCAMTFASYRGRSEHLSQHWDRSRCRCAVCGARFKNKQHFLRHVAVHTGERAFSCAVCERRFNQGGHLKSHMRLHTGERPYKCKLCDKSFTHNVSLKSHVQRYHPAEREETERESQTQGADGQTGIESSFLGK